MNTILKILMGLLSTVVTLGLLSVVGIVGFHYIRLVENEPLSHPVRVTAWSAQQLDLEDGRVISFAEPDNYWQEPEIREPYCMVEVKPLAGDVVGIYIKRRTFICGTGAPWLTIPLVAVEIPKYQRKELALMGQLFAR